MAKQKLEYYVGYEKLDDGIKLYTTFPQAVHLLAQRKVEFYYSETAMCMTAMVNKLPAKIGGVVFYEELAINNINMIMGSSPEVEIS